MTYYKKVESTDPKLFGERLIEISFAGETKNVIPVHANTVLCDGCNKNQYPNPVFLVYLDKEDYENNHPYDSYCEKCLKELFPKARSLDEE